MKKKKSIAAKVVSAILTMVLAVQPMGTALAATAGQPVSEPLETLFSDDFESDDIGTDWQFPSTGEFTLEKDEQENTWFRVKGLPWDGKAYVNDGLEEWKSYSIQMDFIINEWMIPDAGMAPYDCVGVVGRVQGNDKIAVYYRRASKTLELNKMYGNEGHVLMQKAYELKENTCYTMKLELAGNIFLAYVAEKGEGFGSPVLIYEDTGNSGPVMEFGGAGVESGGCDVSVDNFVVERISDEAPEIPVEGISLNKEEMLLKKGETEALTAEIAPVAASNKTVLWKSSDENVAVVDENGVVTAVSAGNAVITAYAQADETKSAECKVEVYEQLQCETFYYVAPNGDDANGNGSEENPFATIQRARDEIRKLQGNIPDGGITVYLREGEYYQSETLEFTPEDSGKPGKPIVYTSYPGEQAVITGAKDIDGWKLLEEVPYMSEEAKGNLYVADIEKGWRFHDLYVDGERQQVSQQMETIQFRQWPQFSGALGEPDTKFLELNPEKGIKVRFNEGELDGLEGNPDIEINCMTVMFWNALPILTDINEEENTAYLYSYNPCNFGGQKNCFNSREGGWYSILNDIKYLDQPGEWCVDSRAGKVYYWPKDENFTSKRTVAPVPYELIRFQGDEEDQNWEKQVEYITLDNLVMEYTDRLPESQFDQYPEIRNVENPDGAIFMQGVSNCRVTNSVVRHTGSYGFTLSHYAQENEILHNEIGDLGSGGVNLLGYGAGTTDLNKNNVIMYNNIHDLGRAPYLHTAGVTIFQSGGNTVSYNYISNSPYAGVTILGIELASFNSSYNGAAWDFFGDQSRQFGMRWDELELNKDYTREESKAYLHSRDNTVEYNIIDEYMNGLEDGGGLYAWGCGYDNAYLNNIIIKTQKGMHWTFPLYMDDQVDRMTVAGNRIWSMEQGTTNKGDNVWSDNLAAWPEKPDGYDELYNTIMSKVNEAGGYIVSEDVGTCVLNSPADGAENVDLPATLSWSPAKNASKYTVEVASDANFENVIFEQLELDTEVTLSDLQYETTYYWRVTAHGLAGGQTVSDIAAFTIKEQGIASVPTNVKVYNDYDSVLIKWTESLNTTYDIYRKAEGDGNFEKIASGIPVGNYLDNSVLPGERYEYYVKGVTQKGESDASETVSITVNYTKLLFEDNFDNGASDQWTETNGKEMSVSDGVCHLDGSGYSFFVNVGDKEWVDYAVEMDVNFKGTTENAPDWTGFGPITRAVTTGDFNQFVSRGVTGIQEAIMCDGNRYWTYFDSRDAFDFTQNEWHKMRVEHTGNLMRCYIDNQLIFEVESTGFKPYGGAGFGFIYEIADVDNFKVIAVDETPASADKTLLQKTYDYALTLSTEGVTDSAKAYFEKAVAEAKAVLDDANATQEEVNTAWDNLLEGIWALGFTQGDKTMLEQLIAKAEEMEANSDKYVQDTWQQLVDALAKAKEVMADGDAMEEDVQPAAEALLNAILAQRFKADKSILESLVNKAEGMDLSGYTAESVAVFTAVFQSAKAVLADETLSEDDQAVVDEAVKDLRDAIENLSADTEDNNPDDGKDDTSKPDNNKDDESSGTNSGENESPATGDADLTWAILLSFAAIAMLGLLMEATRKIRKWEK